MEGKTRELSRTISTLCWARPWSEGIMTRRRTSPVCIMERFSSHGASEDNRRPGWYEPKKIIRLFMLQPEMKVSMKKTIKPCEMCTSAYTDPELDSDHDLSYFSIGEWESGYRALLRSGAGQATGIIFERWGTTWQTVGFYRPKFCPNCGRELAENTRYEQKTKGVHR